MSREEVKSAIKELLDTTPTNTLTEVFVFLKSVHNKSTQEIELTQDLRTILTEDRELLQLLAK